MRQILLLAASMLVLSACGGGGGQAGVAPPPPSAAPSPTPSPAPAPSPTYETATDRSKDRSFAGTGSRVSGFFYNGNSEPGVNLTSDLTGRARYEGTAIAYNAATQTYTVTFDATQQTFGPAELRSGDMSSGSYVKGLDDLAVTTPPNFTYLTLVRWSTTAPEERRPRGFGRQNDDRYYVVGIPTLASDLPRSGEARYNMQFAGIGYGTPSAGGGYSGNSQLDVNFGTGALSMAMNVGTASDMSPDPFTMTLNASLASGVNDIRGTITSANSAYRGDYIGRFYGPAAVEIGGTVALTNGVNGAISGVLYGRKQ